MLPTPEFFFFFVDIVREFRRAGAKLIGENFQNGALWLGAILMENSFSAKQLTPAMLTNGKKINI